jgi:hypothetical protein
MYSYESAGNVTIIIRAINPINLMGINYAANDVVAVFDNAYFSLNFINNNKPITQGQKTLLHYNVMNLGTVMIEPKSITHTAYNFIASKSENTGSILVPAKETISSDVSGSVFLRYIPTNQKQIFIKNANRETVTGYTVNYETGQITNLTANENYICFYYKIEERLISYTLDQVMTPYFSIEILGQNNTNNISREMLISIPKASIDISTVMDFKEDQLTAIQLTFIVIEGAATINYY